MSGAHEASSLIALAGLPNCGKTSLFNALTGSRQKVANYPGVTVERKEGVLALSDGRTLRVLDLPGTYSLDARTPDEAITRDVLLGRVRGEDSPALLIAVADATNLERNLGLVLELRDLGVPFVLALNMMDLACRRGLDLDLERLAIELRVPVVPTVAVNRSGLPELVGAVDAALRSAPKTRAARDWNRPDVASVRARVSEVDRILATCTRRSTLPALWTERLDRIFLHPVLEIGRAHV